jgi:hypothetical protein
MPELPLAETVIEGLKAGHDHLLIKVGISKEDALKLGAPRIPALTSPASISVAQHQRPGHGACAVSSGVPSLTAPPRANQHGEPGPHRALSPDHQPGVLLARGVRRPFPGPGTPSPARAPAGTARARAQPAAQRLHLPPLRAQRTPAFAT